MIIGNIRQPISTKKTFFRSECAWFYSSRDQNWLLSNFAGGMPIYFDGIKWHSSEQLYQSCKYSSQAQCLPASSQEKANVNPFVRQRIIASTNARGAKLTQKCAEKAGLLRRDWVDPAKEIRIHAMLWTLELKLSCNGIFKDALLATGNKPIVEVSRKDDFWGCLPDGDRLTGKNILGQLLSDLRSRIDEVSNGRLSFPDGWLLP